MLLIEQMSEDGEMLQPNAAMKAEPTHSMETGLQTYFNIPKYEAHSFIACPEHLGPTDPQSEVEAHGLRTRQSEQAQATRDFPSFKRSTYHEDLQQENSNKNIIPGPPGQPAMIAGCSNRGFEPQASFQGMPEHVFANISQLAMSYPLVMPCAQPQLSPRFIGVRKNRGGKYSARIKISKTNKYIGTYNTAVEAAEAFDHAAMQHGRPVETLNFPANHGGPVVGQAYRKKKQNQLYEDPENHINVLLRKLSDVDRSNPGILRMTMGTLGVPQARFEDGIKYAGIRKQANHFEARIRYKEKLFSMGFFSSAEAAALAWDITAASLRRCQRLNFPEVSFADLEQQLDALKCVISATPVAGGMAYFPSIPYPTAPSTACPNAGATQHESHMQSVCGTAQSGALPAIAQPALPLPFPCGHGEHIDTLNFRHIQCDAVPLDEQQTATPIELPHVGPEALDVERVMRPAHEVLHAVNLAQQLQQMPAHAEGGNSTMHASMVSAGTQGVCEVPQSRGMT